VGWGECGPIPGLSRDDIPDFAEEAAAICGAINAGYTPTQADLAHLPSFAFGLDTALRDLAGGGSHVLWDTAFTRCESTLPTHGLIWMDSPEGLLQQIEAKIAAGFAVIKMKVGALPLTRELELLAIIRASYPPGQIELRLDANGAFDPATALAALEQFARFDIAFLEQPIAAGQWPLTAELCRYSPVPIALDEELIPVADAETRGALLDTIRPEHLVVKPALLGGFTAAEEWIADAEARGIQWWTNSLLESNIGLSAICQWTAALSDRPSSERIHGIGTGGLFTNNFPSPVRLAGSRLIYDRELSWNLPLPPHA
jgi:o-succinylbenzoate synthase